MDQELEVIRNKARALGIKPHPRAKKETILAQINQQPIAMKRDVMRHEAEAPATPEMTNSEEDVRTAIAQHLEKDGYKATFPGDNTVILEYKGAQESCNLSIPLRVIKMKAETVARGALRLRSLGKTGNSNSYSDHVLA